MLIGDKISLFTNDTQYNKLIKVIDINICYFNFKVVFSVYKVYVVSTEIFYLKNIIYIIFLSRKQSISLFLL